MGTEPRKTDDARAYAGGFGIDTARYYHPGHAWVKEEGTGTVRIGVDAFATRLLGPLEGIRLPSRGDELTQGTPGWSFLTPDARVPILSPVSGEVVEVNPEIDRLPSLVHEDPYGRGWLVRLRSSRMQENLSSLLSGDPVRQWIEALASRLRIRMTGDVVLTLQDGGDVVDDLSGLMVEDRWMEIVREFLLTEPEDA